MPRIELNAERCAGHALCNAVAPDVYQLDDNGYCVAPTVIDESLRASAMSGADACPEQVLNVLDD